MKKKRLANKSELKPYPRYPNLLIEKTNEKGDVKIKGLRGWHDPRYPMLRALTQKEKKDFKDLIREIAEKRKSTASSNGEIK